jgi:hypothetical protein
VASAVAWRNWSEPSCGFLLMVTLIGPPVPRKASSPPSKSSIRLYAAFTLSASQPVLP